MTFFLDTDICIFALRGEYVSLQAAFRALKPERVKVPSIVAAELFLGAYKCRNSLTAEKAVDAFLEPFDVIPFDRDAAEVYAQLRADLESRGMAIGPNDLLIAATTLAHRGILVTHNKREFSRVPGLHLQDWTQQDV